MAVGCGRKSKRYHEKGYHHDMTSQREGRTKGSAAVSPQSGIVSTVQHRRVALALFKAEIRQSRRFPTYILIMERSTNTRYTDSLSHAEQSAEAWSVTSRPLHVKKLRIQAS